MTEWLKSLGLPETAALIVEISSYITLIASAAYVIINQGLKSFRLLHQRLKVYKNYKDKLVLIKRFCKWFSKAILDGKITDEEIDEVSRQLVIVQSSKSIEEDDKSL